MKNSTCPKICRRHSRQRLSLFLSRFLLKTRISSNLFNNLGFSACIFLFKKRSSFALIRLLGNQQSLHLSLFASRILFLSFSFFSNSDYRYHVLNCWCVPCARIGGVDRKVGNRKSWTTAVVTSRWMNRWKSRWLTVLLAGINEMTGLLRIACNSYRFR